MKIQDFEKVSELRNELGEVLKAKALNIGVRGFRISRLEGGASSFSVIEGWRDGERRQVFEAIRHLVEGHFDEQEKRIKDELVALGVTIS